MDTRIADLVKREHAGDKEANEELDRVRRALAMRGMAGDKEADQALEWLRALTDKTRKEGEEHALFAASDEEIIDRIYSKHFTTHCLIDHDCWSYICGVRGRNSALVTDDAWIELCRERGQRQWGH